jgi:(E)-4-hydroxy-3-methylbut-2-enyl-diphosphate synthase
MHGESPIKRRESRKIWVGNVPVGGDAPIAVQSMTNSDTNDVAATVAQINRLEAAGVDIVRISVPDMDAAEAFGKIKKLVKVPLVADIHFDYKIALRVAELGVDCLRINPGNIGREDRVRAVVDAARDRGIPIRIGVNAGSLEKDLQKKYGEPTPAALVESALRHVEHLERLNFQDFKVSVKASDVFMAVAAYRLLAKEIVQPLHLGITEAGGLRSGTVKSAVGLGMLLAEGIGDTIRISLAADPVEEVKVGYDILKSLHLRSHRLPELLAAELRCGQNHERAGRAPRRSAGAAGCCSDRLRGKRTGRSQGSPYRLDRRHAKPDLHRRQAGAETDE